MSNIIKYTLIIGALLYVPYTIQADSKKPEKKEVNLIRNGDFSKSRTGWSGSMSITFDKETKNRYAKIRCKRKEIEFGQNIKSMLRKNKNLKTVEVSFKAKVSKDYKPHRESWQMSIMSAQKSSASGNSFTLKGVHEWKEFSCTLRMSHGEKYKKLEFSIYPADGEVYFDDIVLKAK